MKKSFKIVMGLVCLAMGLFLFFMNNDTYKVERNSLKTIETELGDEVTLKLRSNGSTGYENCWLNAKTCNLVSLKSKKYKSSWAELTGSNGAGGDDYFTFKVINTGIDTICIVSCPTGPEQRECEDYEDHPNLKIDFQIVITSQ